jgi:RNA polymerase sigma-70 factor (ECF subfamily)
LLQDHEDTAAVRRCLSGETAAFEGLVARHQATLYGVASRMLGNREDAKDATQNAFVRAFERLHSYDPAFRFFSWIYRILVNECLNVLRARRPQEPLRPATLVTDGPLANLEVEERRQRVRTALRELSEDHRDVVVLRHFADMSYEEIGATLGVPARTVKSRLFTARQRLGAALLGWETR